MPATAGRVRMPHDNRIMTSKSLNTNAVWQNVIGHDPYAAAGAAPAPDDHTQASLDKSRGLMELAKLQAATTVVRPTCRKCKGSGHLTHECKNMVSLGSHASALELVPDEAAGEDEEDAVLRQISESLAARATAASAAPAAAQTSSSHHHRHRHRDDRSDDDEPRRRRHRHRSSRRESDDESDGDDHRRHSSSRHSRRHRRDDASRSRSRSQSRDRRRDHDDDDSRSNRRRHERSRYDDDDERDRRRTREESPRREAAEEDAHRHERVERADGAGGRWRPEHDRDVEHRSAAAADVDARRDSRRTE